MQLRLAVALLALIGVSSMGINEIAKHEGERLVAYTPVKGDVPTIGVGATTYEDGSRVKLGDKITPERSKQLLKHHVGIASKAVIQCAQVPMHRHEFDVYVSFTYNVGTRKFCESTMAKMLRSGDYAGACSQLKRWVNFQGNPLRGLVNRREIEYKMCMGAA